MSVIHTSAGYTGTVDEIAEAKRFATLAPRFRTASVNDWALSVSDSVNRTIRISPGNAAACGVLDSTGSEDTVAFAANNGGSDRFDALLATFDWAAHEGRAAHSVTFRALQGTTSPPAVNASAVSIDASKINR